MTVARPGRLLTIVAFRKGWCDRTNVRRPFFSCAEGEPRTSAEYVEVLQPAEPSVGAVALSRWETFMVVHDGMARLSMEPLPSWDA